LVSFGDMVGEVTAGLSRFDFLAIKRAADRGMKRMGDAFVQMNNSLDSVVRMLKQDINKLLGIDMFDIPAPDGGGGGGNIPPDTGAPGGNDSGRARTGTKEQRALLDTLAMAEGTYNSGYSTWLGFRKHGPDDLTNLTIDEVHDLQGTFLSKFGAKSAAVGRYQFVPLREHARRFGANTSTQKFTPEFQDRLALFLAENRGVDTKKPIDSNDVLLLGKEWASVPGGGYGQDRYTVNQVLDMYKSLYGTVNMSPNVQAPPAAIQQKAAGAPPAAKTPKVGQDIKYTPQEIEALKKANPDLDIESLLGSNVKNYSSQLAMALQNGKRKPKTNTLIFNNTVKQTEYIAEPSSGGSTIIVAGGLNSSDRRNKYLSTLA
jgi:muramidase (phage lysozyme)